MESAVGAVPGRPAKLSRRSGSLLGSALAAHGSAFPPRPGRSRRLLPATLRTRPSLTAQLHATLTGRVGAVQILLIRPSCGRSFTGRYRTAEAHVTLGDLNAARSSSTLDSDVRPS